jgi:hypothetical protein
MEHEGQKDLKVQNGSKEKNGTGKKNPGGGRDLLAVKIGPGAWRLPPAPI